MSQFIFPFGRMDERCRLLKRMWGSLGPLLYALTMKDETRWSWGLRVENN